MPTPPPPPHCTPGVLAGNLCGIYPPMYSAKARLHDLIDCCPPASGLSSSGSSLQARMLERAATSFPTSPALAGGLFTTSAAWEALSEPSLKLSLYTGFSASILIHAWIQGSPHLWERPRLKTEAKSHKDGKDRPSHREQKQFSGEIRKPK